MLLLTFNKFGSYEFTENAETKFTIKNTPIVLAESTKEELSSTVQTSKSIWDASIILSKYFENNQQKIKVKAKKIIELGAGKGLVGISLGILEANVVITDVGSVISSIKDNIKLNNLSNVIAKELDWFNPKEEDRYDIIVAADVIWVSELIVPLLDTIDILSRKNPEVVVYLAHQQRSLISDRLFFDGLVDRGFTIEVVTDLDSEFQKELINIYKIFL
jgi:predicted nicotinamide N-methyase